MMHAFSLKEKCKNFPLGKFEKRSESMAENTIEAMLRN